jgi:glycosyltransferase involved in cell wall biosynthesis
LRNELNLPATGRIIGIVGRLQHWKGFHLLLAALPRILASFPDVACVMVGGEHALEPCYPAFLRAKIDEANLSDRVRMVGLQKNVPRWMKTMDVVVHASDREPFGMVVIEAMALGCRVVASDVGGPREIITHDVNGLLWRHGDIDSLSDAIVRLLADSALADSIGRAARRRAADFVVERYAHNVARAVSDLLPLRGRSSGKPKSDEIPTPWAI